MPEPSWWLAHLTAEMDRRRPRLALLRSYLDGYPPLPEGAEGQREAYAQFQRKAARNFAELVTDAVAERMIVGGFRVGDQAADDDAARRLWKRNNLGVWAGDVHRDMLGLSVGYVCVQPGPEGVEITHERPEQVVVEHDPARPDRRRAGLKTWRDEVQGWDTAYLHLPGVVIPYRRDIPVVSGRPRPILTYSGGWRQAGAPADTGLPRIPLVPFVNRGGLGEFETHTGLLDSINWHVLQRLVLIAMQAYRQRAIKGDLPEVDEDGNPIDYGELLKPGPGALWELPDGVDLWESAQADLTGVLESAKADLRDLAAVTRTPMATLMPDGANQTAEGASFAKEGLVFKARDRIARAAASWSEVLRLALPDTGAEVSVDVVFLPPEQRSLAEKADAATKLGSTLPWRALMTDVMQYDGDAVDRMAAERAEDAMLAAVAAPPAPAPGADSGRG